VDDRLSDRDRWNARYGALVKAGADRRPTRWLVEHRELLEAQPKGRALDVACGLGRNAFFLADLGFAVDAVDVSDVAVAAVARRAGETGAVVRAMAIDLTTAPVPDSGYQVVVNVNFLERRILGSLEQALAPGGLLVFETFLPDHEVAMGPTDPAHVLRPGELLEVFGGLTVEAYREGRPNPGERARAGLVARRQA
jgi:SAM-dependent methyltransferase